MWYATKHITVIFKLNAVFVAAYLNFIPIQFYLNWNAPQVVCFREVIWVHTVRDLARNIFLSCLHMKHQQGLSHLGTGPLTKNNS